MVTAGSFRAGGLFIFVKEMINIAIKLLTSVTYTATGEQTTFAIPFDYLRPAFVYVSVDEQNITEGFEVVDRTVKFSAPPAKGAVVRIYRSTTTKRLVSWADASILKAKDMTAAEVQQLHLIEEEKDWSRENTVHIDKEGVSSNQKFDPSFRVKPDAFIKTNSKGTGLELYDKADMDADIYREAGKYINDHPEYVTTVMDGAVSESKLAPTLAKKKASWYKSVAEMKADSLLSAGMTACTLGYYAPNDGGAGTYIIRAKQDSDVDDGGSLHELANGNVAELVVENGTVNVKQFGAKGDGVTDDTDAFQKALNSNKTVTVTNGTYYLNNTIDNPQIIKIIGEDKRKTKLKLNNSFLKNKIQYSEIKNIGFSCTQTNDITVFPALVYSSTIKDNVFTYFKNIFMDVENLTHIENNHFSFIQGCFCNKIIDSFVNGNYINAPKTKNPQTIAFKDVAHTRITNNFIDFMYKVFERQTVGDSKAIVVVGNTFDVCFCIFYNTCVGVTFIGNSISNMERLRVIKTETNPNGWDVSENEEMNTTDWCVIKRINSKGSLIDSVLANNTVYDMRLDKYLICTNYSYPTHDVIIDEALPNDKFIYKAYKSRNERDFENIMIKPMLKRTVETLPSAELSGNCTTFNNDEVVYNGDLYVNLNGVWKKIS